LLLFAVPRLLGSIALLMIATFMMIGFMAGGARVSGCSPS